MPAAAHFMNSCRRSGPTCDPTGFFSWICNPVRIFPLPSIARRRPPSRSRSAWEPASTPLTLDSSAFALGGQGKVRGDDDFVFYNQPALPGGGIQRAGDGRAFTVAFGQLPAAIERIVVALTIDQGPAARPIVRPIESSAGGNPRRANQGILGDFSAGDQNDGRRPRSSSANFTCATANGSSAPSARVSSAAWGRWPASTAWMSATIPMRPKPPRPPPQLRHLGRLLQFPHPHPHRRPPPNPSGWKKSPWTSAIPAFRWRKRPKASAKSWSISTGIRVAAAARAFSAG
jgi:hypothetical protein